MKESSQSIEKRILSRILGSRKGAIFAPSDFLDVGSRRAVDLALHRLTRKNTLRRLTRGLYEYPREHPELGMLSPDIQKIAKALAGKNRLRLQPAGAYAANLLGLSEQVPAKVIFLTERAGGKAWMEFQVDAATHSPVMLFHYPSNEPTGFDYLGRSVKMEFGALTDQRPVGTHPICPWAAEEFPKLLGNFRCQVVALELERTFWERRPFCTRSTIARRRRRCATVSRGITPTWRRWRIIRWSRGPWLARICGSAWRTGRGDSSRRAGHVTIWQDLDHRHLRHRF